MSNTITGPQKLASLAKRDHHYYLAFTAILALVSIGGTLWFDVPLTFETSSPLVALPFFFGPLTLVTGLIAFRGFLRQRKIGTPVLEYSPARLGGMFSGAVVLDKRAEVSGDYAVKLTCHDYGTRDYTGERSRKSPKVIWTGTLPVARADAQASGRINFTIKLPSRQQLSNEKGETYWQMDVKAPMRGVNFFARFSPLRFT
jgi:hypothetical protein